MSVARRASVTRHVVSWLRQLDEAGLRPVVTVLEVVQGDDWPNAERRWITYFREHGALTNHTDGGEGCPGRTGWHHTAETRAKIARTKAAAPQTQEMRDRVGRGNRGALNGRAKLTEVTVQEIKVLILRHISDREIASRFGVSRTLIGQIRRNQKWAHVAWPRSESPYAERTDGNIH